MNMINKIKILYSTITSTKVTRGSSSFFIFYFCVTHSINIVGKDLPRLADFMRKSALFFILKTPQRTRVFTIQNKTGIFEVTPLNDSMTISADYFEAHLLPWLDKPRQKRVCIDIGAHMGRYSILALKHFHYDKVVAIEANPRTFTLLKKNIELNTITKKVTLVPIALGNQKGTLEFESNENNLAVAHVVTSRTTLSPRNKVIQVASDRASEVLRINHVNYKEIDFIKMDVEGFEYQVLDGMKEILEDMQSGSYVMIEISNPENRKAQDVLEHHSFSLQLTNGADYLYVKN